jgi:hypothetical protein
MPLFNAAAFTSAAFAARWFLRNLGGYLIIFHVIMEGFFAHA